MIKRLKFDQTSHWILKLVAQLGLWLSMVLIVLIIWNLWFLQGPHGPYRWTGSDFAPYWVGVREMLIGNNPYSAETTLKIQQVVYGGPVLTEDPMMFVYPAWLFILIVPFALLPFKISVTIITATFLWGLLNLFFLFAQQWSGQNPILRSIWTLILVIGSLPFIVISITKGQLGYLALFVIFASRRLWERKPFWAGFLLAMAIIKPTVAIIPILGFLIWAFIEQNWKYILGFFISVLILIITSWIAVGNWVWDYLAVLRTTGGMPVLWSLDSLSWPWKAFYASIFGGIAVYAFFLSWKRKKRDFWCSAMILTGIALFPMRWIYDLYISILIPSEESQLPKISGLFVGIAVIAPWCLVFLPNNLRGASAVIGIPLIWAITLLVLEWQKKVR